MEKMERKFLENLAMFDYIHDKTETSPIFNAYEPLSTAENPSARDIYNAEVERLKSIEANDKIRFIALSSEIVGIRNVPHDITYNQPLSNEDLSRYNERPSAFLENMYAKLGNAGVQPPNFYGHSPSVGDTFVILTPEMTEGHFVDRFGFEQENDKDKLMTKENWKLVQQGWTTREEFSMLQVMNEYADNIINESSVKDLVKNETKGRLDFLKDHYTMSFNLAAIREVETQEMDKLQILYNWEESNGIEDFLVVGERDGHYFINSNVARNMLPEASRLGEGFIYDDYNIAAGEKLQAEIDRRFERAAREISADNVFFYRFEVSPTPLGENKEYDAFVQRYERINNSTYPREIVYLGNAKEAAEVTQHLNAGSELGEFIANNIRLRSILNYDVLSGNLDKAAIAKENEQFEENERSRTIEKVMDTVDKTVVAIESTDDYTDDSFHADFTNSDIQNEDGSYGHIVERYRLVTINENSKVVPFDNGVYLSREEARQSAKEKGLILTDYDSIVYEAMGMVQAIDRVEAEQDFPHREEEQLVDIYNLEYDEEGYLHFVVAADGYELEGLYRLHDLDNGEDMTLVSIDYADRHPIVIAQWNKIEQMLYDTSLDRYNSMIKAEQEIVQQKENNTETNLSQEQLALLVGEDSIIQENIRLFIERGATIEQAAVLKGSQAADYYLLSDKMLNGTISTDVAKAIVQTVREIRTANEQDYMKQKETIAEPKARFDSFDLEFFTEYFADMAEKDNSITADTIVMVGRSFIEQTQTNNLKQFVSEHGGMANFNPYHEEVIKENPVISTEEQKEAQEGVSISNEKKDPKERLSEQLQEGIKQVLNSENFKNWLDTSSKMFYNNYSFSNAMLVWMQRPDATHTMGYEQWKEYGRNVTQGANSIKIFVPCIAYEKKDGDLWRMIKANLDTQMRNNPSLEQAVYRVGMSKLEITMNQNHLYGLRIDGKERGIQSEKDIQNFIKHNIIGKVPMYFTVGNVFDVKDTVIPKFLWVKKGYTKDELVMGEDGKPIKNRRGEYKIYNTPERQARYTPSLDMSVPQKEPAKMAILYDALKAVSERNGIHVYEKERAEDSTLKGGADGYFSRDFSSENPKGYIVMPTDLDPTKAVSVMLHEMSHSELHGNLKKLAQRMGEDNIPSHMREIQAESVAYVVGKNFGIETDMSSFQYLAAYTKGFELQALTKSIEVIYNECKQLTRELKSELEVRGLNMDLSERVNEPLTKEAIQTLSKSYATFAVERSERISDIEKELPLLAEQNAEHTQIMTVLVEQGLCIERQKEGIEAIRNAVTELGNANTLDEQKNAITAAEAAKGRIEKEVKLFDELTEEGMAIKQNEQGLKNKFVTDPIATLESMKEDYPLLDKLTTSQIEYLAKSKYVNRDLSPMLRNKPEKFVEAAYERASQIDKVASKNGFFVEVNYCEQWIDKPIVQDGSIMHPKVIDNIIKQSEFQVRTLKLEAEKQNDYFPYCKCNVTVFRASQGKIDIAYNTRVDIGDGEQDSFVDHLKQMSSTRDYVADFEKATREKGAKEKILFNTHGEEVKEVNAPLQDVPKSELTMSREEWEEQITAIRNEEQEQPKQEQEQTQEKGQDKSKNIKDNMEK